MSPRPHQFRCMAPKFFLFVEGESEVAYFERFRTRNLPLSIQITKTNHRDCNGIIEETKRRLVNLGYNPDVDRAAVIFDVDQNGPDEICKAIEECRKCRVELYISNPSFEYWLCFHFGKVQGIHIQGDLEVLMTRNLGRPYRKGADLRKEITDTMISDAVTRAESVLKSEGMLVEACLKHFPSTTLHVLVKALKEILEAPSCPKTGNS